MCKTKKKLYESKYKNKGKTKQEKRNFFCRRFRGVLFFSRKRSQDYGAFWGLFYYCFCQIDRELRGGRGACLFFLSDINFRLNFIFRIFSFTFEY